MNSIQLNLETFAKNILELDIIGLGLSKYMDRAELLTQDFLLRHVQLNIESLDEGLKESPESREAWRILKKEPRELVTKAGILRYRRRYFAHIHSNEKCFLVDKLLGSLHIFSPFEQEREGRHLQSCKSPFVPRELLPGLR